MSKCSDCINECQLYGITGRCDGCVDDSLFEPKKTRHKKSRPLTHYDLLIRKSPEELAAWIVDHPVASNYNENNPQHRHWLEWLKQESGNEAL